MYADDLKLFVKNLAKMGKYKHSIASFSTNIRMKFGLENYEFLHTRAYNIIDSPYFLVFLISQKNTATNT